MVHISARSPALDLALGQIKMCMQPALTCLMGRRPGKRRILYPGMPHPESG